MKKALTVLYSTLLFVIPTLGGISTAFAQGSADSVRITHTQEAGTLEKQRFIDRYDYVFMTKEPTKWMLKLAGTSSQTHGGLVGSYEYKLSPSISLGAGAYFRAIASGLGTDAGIFGEVRYYYDMRKRIIEGKNANNFTGNYFALTYTKAFSQGSTGGFTGTGFGEYIPVVGMTSATELRWGMQRRFFNHGLVDFGVGAGIKNANRIGATNLAQSEVFIQTFWNTSLAFGDFKSKTLPPPCDVLKCYETSQSLWKIAWPNLAIGTRNQTLLTSLAFERQIGTSPFSINFQNNLLWQRWTWDRFPIDSANVSMKVNDMRFLSTTYLQARFYLSKLKRTLQPKSSLSGFYVGASLMHVYERINYTHGNERVKLTRYHGIEVGPTIGFQMKVFKNNYLDLGLTVGKTIYRFDKNSTSGGLHGFRPSFKIGFTF